VLTHVLAAVLFLVPALPAQPPKGDGPQGDKPFDDVTLEQIKASVEEAKKGGADKIDGSDTKDNRIPNGTVLCYITSDKRYGKLKVVEYGYDLAVKWVTYDGKGGVFSKGDKLVVRGTWSCDLDAGVEGDPAAPAKDDFWWEQVDQAVRRLVFRNGAVFAVYSPKK
jgi:hypothetical protein